MINFKQFVFLTAASIFCVPRGLQAMDQDISLEPIKQQIVVEASSQEIKQTFFSLKQLVFNSLFKDEESQNKIPKLIKKKNIPSELMYELAIQVARKASFNTIPSIAKKLPVALYPDMGLELLCSRNEKESRGAVLQFLLDNSPQQTIQQTKQTTEQAIELTPEQEAARSNLEAMIYLSNHRPDVGSVDEEAYKNKLFLYATTMAFKNTSIIQFLLKNGIKPSRGFLEQFFLTLQYSLPVSIKNSVKKDEKIEFKDKSLEINSEGLSDEDKYICYYAHDIYDLIFKNIKNLLIFGLRPSRDRVILSSNSTQSQTSEETLFEHIANRLAFLRLKKGLNIEYATMAVEDKILGIEINDDSNRIATQLSQFYTGKPENDTISYLETTLHNTPFAQKLPLFEVLVDVKIQTYKKLLYLLMPHCKDELSNFKEQLEQEFQMPLDELVKESEGVKK